jgi:hypothetical protein
VADIETLIGASTFAGDLPEIIDVGVPDIYSADDPALVAELMDALLPLVGPPSQIALPHS